MVILNKLVVVVVVVVELSLSNISGFALSLPLLVLPLLREVFLRVLRFSPLLKNQHFRYGGHIWNARTRLNEFIRTPKYFVGKRITITITKAWDNSPDRTFYLEQKLCLVPSSFLGFSTLAPMQEAFPCAFTFLKVTLPTLFSYIKTFDKCISCVFKDYLFFERCLETQTNKQNSHETVDAFPQCYDYIT